MKFQLVTPYCGSHFQCYGITVHGNVTSVYPCLVFTYVAKEYNSFISRFEGSKRTPNMGNGWICIGLMVQLVKAWKHGEPVCIFSSHHQLDQ